MANMRGQKRREKKDVLFNNEDIARDQDRLIGCVQFDGGSFIVGSSNNTKKSLVAALANRDGFTHKSISATAWRWHIVDGVLLGQSRVQLGQVGPNRTATTCRDSDNVDSADDRDTRVFSLRLIVQEEIGAVNV